MKYDLNSDTIFSCENKFQEMDHQKRPRFVREDYDLVIGGTVFFCRDQIKTISNAIFS